MSDALNPSPTPPAQRPITGVLHGRTFNAYEFTTMRAAVDFARRRGGRALMLGDRRLVVDQPEAERLEVEGVVFAFLTEHAGRVMTIPVNDD
jgi:hypothetical protein